MVVGDFLEKVETVVIGGGPGGYVAAIRAAQLGQDVVLIEKADLGGICLNWGCIPSKAMIEVASLKQHLGRAVEFGLVIPQVDVDFSRMHQWKNSVIEKLRNGITTLIEKNEITLVTGTARFVSPRQILVESAHGLSHFEFKQAIIATGSRPAALPELPFDSELVLDSRAVLNLPVPPQHLLVIGAGSIGLELGIAWRKFGSQVTILEAQTDLLPFLDSDIPRVLARSLSKLGIELQLGAQLESVKPSDGEAEVTYLKDKKPITVTVDKILLAVGRNPNTNDIGLDKLPLEPDSRDFLPVNDKMQTVLPQIYAIGDVVAGPMLAHRASFQGKIAAEAIAGHPVSFDNLAIPGVIFSDPEIATVGLTEQAAIAAGYTVKTGTFPFSALGRALTLGETDGLTKIVSDAESGVVLGVHIIGPHASDLIAEGTLAVESAAHIDDLSLTIHAHPTLPEGLMEASEALQRKAIHIFQP